MMKRYLRSDLGFKIYKGYVKRRVGKQKIKVREDGNGKGGERQTFKLS